MTRLATFRIMRAAYQWQQFLVCKLLVQVRDAKDAVTIQQKEVELCQ